MHRDESLEETVGEQRGTARGSAAQLPLAETVVARDTDRALLHTGAIKRFIKRSFAARGVWKKRICLERRNSRAPSEDTGGQCNKRGG